MSASGPPIEEMTAGWRLARTSPSLPESFRSVAIPAGAPWWRKMLAYAAGPVGGMRIYVREFEG